jgi:hypothetical protein
MIETVLTHVYHLNAKKKDREIEKERWRDGERERGEGEKMGHQSLTS